MWTGLRVDPCPNLPIAWSKAQCILVPPSVWCWVSNKPRPRSQNNQVLFCINDQLLTQSCVVGKKHCPGKGKEAPSTKHLEGPNPEPALQIHYLIKSLRAPKTENYPHFTEEETVAQRALIICHGHKRWLTVKSGLNPGLFHPKISFKSTKLPQRPQFLYCLRYLEESLTLQGFLKFFCEMT